MSSFFDQFTPDPEFDGRLLWRTEKPLLNASVVAFAPPYPEYPKLKLSKKRGPTADPSCPSARTTSSDLEVAMYDAGGNGFGATQQKAWEYIVAHAGKIELALRRKLLAWHLKHLNQFRDEELPESKPHQKYWKVIEASVTLEDASAIDSLFKLVGIGLADTGLDKSGFCSFEFQTGWDRDHGLGIVMHRNRVIAAGGMGELISSPDLLATLKAVQAYDFDKGDFKLD